MKFGKFLSLAALCLAFSAPAFANNGTGDGHGGDWGLGDGVYHGNPGNGPGNWWRAPNYRRYPRRGTQCFARDYRGRTYTAFGRRPNRTQRDAVQTCRAYSRNPRTCRPIGCR